MSHYYISQSAIKDFLACKKRFYYRRNFKTESIPTRQMFLGELVHKLLEEHSLERTDALKQIDLLKIKYGLPKDDVALLAESVNGFFSNFYHLTTPEDKKEVMFSIPYESGVSLVGKYDRITPNNMVIDWKSGKYVPATLKNDVQSIIYHYAYKKEFGIEPTVVVGYLRANKLATYTRDDLHEDILLNEVLPNMLDEIRSGRFPHTGLFNGSCRRCTFKEFCYRRLEESEF